MTPTILSEPVPKRVMRPIERDLALSQLALRVADIATTARTIQGQDVLTTASRAEDRRIGEEAVLSANQHRQDDALRRARLTLIRLIADAKRAAMRMDEDHSFAHLVSHALDRMEREIMAHDPAALAVRSYRHGLALSQQTAYPICAKCSNPLFGSDARLSGYCDECRPVVIAIRDGEVQ